MLETLLDAWVQNIGHQTSGAPLHRQPQSAFQEAVNYLLRIFAAVTEIADSSFLRNSAALRLSEEKNDVTEQAILFVVADHVILLKRLLDKLPFKKTRVADDRASPLRGGITPQLIE